MNKKLTLLLILGTALSTFAFARNGDIVMKLKAKNFHANAYLWEMEIDTWDANNLSIATISGTRFLDLYSKNPELIEFKKVSLEQKTHIKTHCLYEISKKKNFKDAKWFIRFDCEGNDLILEWEYPKNIEQIKNYTIYENKKENKTYIVRPYTGVKMQFTEPSYLYEQPGDTTPIGPAIPEGSTFTYLAVTDEAEPVSFFAQRLTRWHQIHLDTPDLTAWIHTDDTRPLDDNVIFYYHYINYEILTLFCNEL